MIILEKLVNFSEQKLRMLMKDPKIQSHLALIPIQVTRLLKAE
jgi:hypothetical protein